MEIHWEITTSCNLRCKHCLLDRYEPRPQELSLAEILQSIECFFEIGVRKVYFTGGEPFIRDDFLTILEHTINLGLRVGVISNGTLLNTEILKRLKKWKVELGISLDGDTPEANDAVRGKGVFNKVIQVLDRCKNIDYPVVIYTVINRQNIGRLTQIQEIADKYGARYVHYSEINIIGRAERFVEEIALSLEERRALSRFSFVPMENPPMYNDCMCWINGSTLYIRSDGEMYPCVELAQMGCDSIGNIRSVTAEDLLRIVSVFSSSYPRSKCKYCTYASNGVSLMRNTPISCSLALDSVGEISTLESLYSVLDVLYANIGDYCKVCTYPDCMGYIWLLPEESHQLYEMGVSLLEINDGPVFINAFEYDGEIDVSKRYPICPLVKKGGRGCTIYENRPLVCRLYPIGLETLPTGQIVWALHTDCSFVDELKREGVLDEFIRQVRWILARITTDLLEKIVYTYQLVDAISKFPEGPNNYMIVEKVKKGIIDI